MVAVLLQGLAKAKLWTMALNAMVDLGPGDLGNPNDNELMTLCVNVKELLSSCCGY